MYLVRKKERNNTLLGVGEEAGGAQAQGPTPAATDKWQQAGASRSWADANARRVTAATAATMLPSCRFSCCPLSPALPCSATTAAGETFLWTCTSPDPELSRSAGTDLWHFCCAFYFPLCPAQLTRAFALRWVTGWLLRGG